jgi:hypothetical protein
LVYRSFGLADDQAYMIDEGVKYTVDFFQSAEESAATSRPDVSMLRRYSEEYLQAANFYLETMGKKLSAEIGPLENPRSPLMAIQFQLREFIDPEPDISVSQEYSRKWRAVYSLAPLQLEKHSQWLYLTRTVRIYDGDDALYVVKPAERRFWTSSQAITDVTNTVAELSAPTGQEQ